MRVNSKTQRLAHIIESVVYANREVNGPEGCFILSDEQLQWVTERYGERITWDRWDGAWSLLTAWGVYNRAVAP